MLAILKGEFFWGIVIGLVLSFFGGWVLARFSVSMQQASAKKMIVLFCIDAIKNIQGIISEMDATRDRAKAIHHDFLALIDVEIQIYGRNREQLIHLPDEERSLVRRFMNDVAVKRAEVSNKLDQFYQIHRLAEQLRAEGRNQEATTADTSAGVPLHDAQIAADRLVSIANGAMPLIEKLLRIR